MNRPAWPRGKLHRPDSDVTGQQRGRRSPVAARPINAHASSTPGASVPVAWRAMYLRPRNVLQRVTARAAPLRAASPTRLARAPRSNPIRLPHSPPLLSPPRSNKVRTSPFPSPRRARTAASHIRLLLAPRLRRLRPLPPPPPSQSPTPPQRAHHGPRPPASQPRLSGCLLAQRSANPRGAPKGTDASAGACSPGVAAPLERGCCAARGQEGCWPEGGGAADD